ncbi:MAG: hypothetical protein EWM72_03132 [Nitrospira sp.]|nr:MAG: hypothetical protein EWM72_03132 [Nitrospira sp.]
MINEADTLRSPARLTSPDPRSSFFARHDPDTGRPKPITPEDQYAAVTPFVLNPSVPEAIVIHFETAKNLYMYAWFVFRFYPIAEQQAFGTLEFALRERQSEFVRDYMERHPRRMEPGLGVLLKNAIKERLVRNETFKARQRWALTRATERYRYEQIEKMRAEGLRYIEFDDSIVTPTDDDLNHDWLSDFFNAIPYLRNEYAHGSRVLHHSVLHTFEVVTELINQLYPNEVNGA